MIVQVGVETNISPGRSPAENKAPSRSKQAAGIMADGERDVAREARKAAELGYSTEIIRLFRLESLSTPAKVMELGIFFINHKPLLKRVHVLHLLYESAKAKIDITDAVPLSELAFILQKSKHSLRAAELGKLMYSLHLFTDKTPGITELLEEVRVKVQSCLEHLSGREIGNALYGLQGFTANTQTTSILTCLLPAIISCEELTSQELGNALYGLRNMDSSSEVLLTLSALAKLIDRSSTPDISAQAIVNAVNGLRSQRGVSVQVEEVLQALLRKLKSCSATFSNAAIGGALMGLQGFEDHAVIREMLHILAIKMQENNEALQPLSLSSILHGLQSQSDEAPQGKPGNCSVLLFSRYFLLIDFFSKGNSKCDHRQAQLVVPYNANADVPLQLLLWPS